MENRTNQEWVRQLKQNDPQTIEDLWKLIFTDAVNLGRRYRLSDDEQRNAAVEAYLNIRNSGIHQFRLECSFHSYCWTVLSREMLQIIRRKKNDPYLAELDEVVEETTAGESDVSMPKDVEKAWESLQPCLDQLKPRDREVIDRRYMQEEDPAEVASHLGISRNYVNVIAHRARRQLRRCLEENGYHTREDLLYAV